MTRNSPACHCTYLIIQVYDASMYRLAQAERLCVKVIGWQYLLQLCGSEGSCQILLVGKNEQGGPCEPFLLEKIVQLIAAVLKPVQICSVYNPDQCICLLVVVPPV